MHGVREPIASMDGLASFGELFAPSTASQAHRQRSAQPRAILGLP